MAIAAMAPSVVVLLACEKSVIVAFIFLNANINYCAELNIRQDRGTIEWYPGSHRSCEPFRCGDL